MQDCLAPVDTLNTLLGIHMHSTAVSCIAFPITTQRSTEEQRSNCRAGIIHASMKHGYGTHATTPSGGETSQNNLSDTLS